LKVIFSLVKNMKSFLAVIIFLLLVIKVIEGLPPLSQFQDDSQSLERRADSTRGSRSPSLTNKRAFAPKKQGLHSGVYRIPGQRSDKLP
jgi:hypothetical protein